MRTFVTHITVCMTIISIGGYRKLEVGTYLPKADPNECCQLCRAIKNSPSRAGSKLWTAPLRSIPCVLPSNARVDDLMNCSDAIVTQASDAYLLYSYYRLHDNYFNRRLP